MRRQFYFAPNPALTIGTGVLNGVNNAVSNYNAMRMQRAQMESLKAQRDAMAQYRHAQAANLMAKNAPVDLNLGDLARMQALARGEVLGPTKYDNQSIRVSPQVAKMYSQMFNPMTQMVIQQGHDQTKGAISADANQTKAGIAAGNNSTSLQKAGMTNQSREKIAGMNNATTIQKTGMNNDSSQAVAGINGQARTGAAQIMADGRVAAVNARGAGAPGGARGGAMSPADKAGLQQLQGLQKEELNYRQIIANPAGHGLDAMTMSPDQIQSHLKAAQDGLSSIQQRREMVYQQYPNLRGASPQAQPSQAPAQASPAAPAPAAPSQSPSAGPLRIYDAKDAHGAPAGALVRLPGGDLHQILQASPDGVKDPVMDSKPFQMSAPQAPNLSPNPAAAGPAPGPSNPPSMAPPNAGPSAPTMAPPNAPIPINPAAFSNPSMIPMPPQLSMPGAIGDY